MPLLVYCFEYEIGLWVINGVVAKPFDVDDLLQRIHMRWEDVSQVALSSNSSEHPMCTHVFPIDRKRADQIVTEAGKKAGLNKRAYPHILRHNDAIEPLKQTVNLKAPQIHLDHASPFMTMRHLPTLTAENALRIQQQSNSHLRRLRRAIWRNWHRGGISHSGSIGAPRRHGESIVPSEVKYESIS